MIQLDIGAHLAALAARDAHLAAAFALVGPPPDRSRPPGFPTLLRIIIGQQVSTAVAQVFWSRITAAIDPITPAALLAVEETALRAFGLSRQKAAYARALAADILEGRLDLDRIAALDDDAAIAALMKLKGIGRWSAEVYLLFALGRPDVFPAADLALAVAMQRVKKLRKRPGPERLIKLAKPWRPYRSAAAHLLWHYYAKGPMD
jgi:DNA-3-methyladenine glycosylase II